METTVNVIGAGLAGTEAAWQLARRGVRVRLTEMKPHRRTPAHSSDLFGELVCSNSLRNAELASAPGLLKEELRRAGSLMMEAADASRVSAGGALAVDRVRFAGYITEKIRSSPLIEVVEAEATEFPAEGLVIAATGPLTSEALAKRIAGLTGESGLSFYDAAAPIVDFATIDMTKAFFASRYGKGDADYINCPMTKDEYEQFYDALIHAEEAPLHEFDHPDSTEYGGKLKVFEGCMPVEVMAKRGEDTLRYGPLKPVGISHPVTGERYYAVVQLRREDEEGTMFNLVGFQTHLTFPEQRRVFRMIPGLENASFLRYGVMHRNTFLNSPALLDADYSLRSDPRIYFAGQMTGVEGYIESAASGFVAGVCAARKAHSAPRVLFPRETMMGAMAWYISHGGVGEFQPMNANFGILPPMDVLPRGGKRVRYEAYATRALETLSGFDLFPCTHG